MLLLLSGALGIISGVTVDQFWQPLGGCRVLAFTTATNTLIGQTTSDPVTGAYSLPVPRGVTHFLVAYKVGSPDLSGTTVNTLIA